MLTRIHQNPGFLPVAEDREGFLKVGRYTEIPDISAAPVHLPAAWFLGPRAENYELLGTLIQAALEHIREYRLGYQVGDPEAISEALKHSDDYLNSVAAMNKGFQLLLDFFKQRETPYFSLRYIGHMLCENTLPALAGYFAGMLHNSNNVTIQASTATTLLEMLVMRDLCHMIGWSTDSSLGTPSWAHITTDGSIANIESVWASRETKFLPFAAAMALRNEAHLQDAASITVKLADDREVSLLDATNWELFNIRRDDILALPRRIREALAENSLQMLDVWSLLVKYDLNARGWAGMIEAFAGIGGPLVILTASTRHYSWPKAAAAMGLGTNSDLTVPVDRDARMDIKRLNSFLAHCLEKKIPILMVLSVNGSTEESAIDPLTDILSLREEYRRKGLEFDIHIDGAWGGYIMSVLRKNFNWSGDDFRDPFLEDTSLVPMSDYAVQQFKAIRYADSVTMDPHKTGYVQYPAGSLLYRNMDVINLLTFSGSYIGSAADPAVGLFGLEGSKPGAAASSVFFNHMCIRPDVDGLGEILSYSLANARQFYTRLLFMAHPGDSFTCVPLALLPAERSGGDLHSELAFLRDRIFGHTTAQIQRDAEAMRLFREIGPDQNIVDYGLNPILEGVVNSDVDVYNNFVLEIYNAFHVKYNKEGVADDIHNYSMMVTMTTFDAASYGQEFMSTFARRLGLHYDARRHPGLNCLRSVVMNPFVSNTDSGSYLDELAAMLHDKANELAVRIPSTAEAGKSGSGARHFS